jgi:hypothetical protein
MEHGGDAEGQNPQNGRTNAECGYMPPDFRVTIKSKQSPGGGRSSKRNESRSSVSI